MIDNTLFYFVFLSQILLISFYFPRKVIKRADMVFENYPPSKYPKLYPTSLEYCQKAQRNFQMINHVILAAGLILLLALLRWDYLSEGMIPDVVSGVAGIIQFIPFMLIELSGFSYFKLMRQADSRTTRKAELHRRHLFEFVSPSLLGLGIFMALFSIFFDLYLHQFNTTEGSNTLVRGTLIVVCNLLFVCIVLWNMYGKKLNPHQAYEDRMQQIKMVVKTLLLLSISMSVYFLIDAARDKFDLTAFESSITSFYFQLIAWISLNSITQTPIESINFDVYKASS